MATDQICINKNNGSCTLAPTKRSTQRRRKNTNCICDRDYYYSPDEPVLIQSLDFQLHARTRYTPKMELEQTQARKLQSLGTGHLTTQQRLKYSN